jgi:hypothetical protein
MFFPPVIKVKLPKLPLENMEELALERLSWITGYDIKNHVSMSHVFIYLQANLCVQEWVTTNGLDCDAPACDQDAWSKLVKDQQTKVRAGVTFLYLSLKLTGVLQDLIQSILDTINGCSPGGPQPEQVRQGVVCFKMSLLRLSRSPLPFRTSYSKGRRDRARRPLLMRSATYSSARCLTFG